MYLKTRLMTGQRQNGKKAQAPLEIRHRRCLSRFRQTSLTGQITLELAASFICVFLLLWGSFQVFLWVSKRFVVRQEDYETTRVSAGSNNPGVEVDESNLAKYPKLNILGN